MLHKVLTFRLLSILEIEIILSHHLYVGIGKREFFLSWGNSSI